MNNLYTAEAKNIKVSPRKMRLVVDGVKKMPITAALATLEVSSKRASDSIRKALKSAVANATHNGKVNKDDLVISEMFVNEGIVYKRYHFAGRGRMRPYKKKTSHLKVILRVKQVALADVTKDKKDIVNEAPEVKKGGSK